ncbi:MAG: hypothetical protein LBJ18_04255, partial [Rickettsiales bacterium]|nr:hypothetical protein [Rickettsiales bacterium]
MRKILAIIAVIGIGWNCAYGCVFISGAGDSNGIGCIKIGTACYTCGTYTAQCSSGCSSTVNITEPTFFSDITATFNYCNNSSWSNLNKVIYQDSTADTSGGGMCAYTLISGSGA